AAASARRAAVFPAALAIDITGFAAALADAGLLRRAVQAEAVVLEKAHRHLHGAMRWPAEHITAGNQIRQLLAHGLAHLLVVAQPVARAAREQVVPAMIIRQFRRCLVLLPAHGILAMLSVAVLFLRQQRGDVIEGFVRAVLVITVIGNQALLDGRYLLLRFGIRPRAGGDQPQHVAPLLEQVLLDGFAQTRVVGQREAVAALVGAHGLAHDFLAERGLAGIGHADLGLDVAQEAFVGIALFAGDGV